MRMLALLLCLEVFMPTEASAEQLAKPAPYDALRLACIDNLVSFDDISTTYDFWKIPPSRHWLAVKTQGHGQWEDGSATRAHT